MCGECVEGVWAVYGGCVQRVCEWCVDSYVADCGWLGLCLGMWMDMCNMWYSCVNGCVDGYVDGYVILC